MAEQFLNLAVSKFLRKWARVGAGLPGTQDFKLQLCGRVDGASHLAGTEVFGDAGRQS